MRLKKMVGRAIPYALIEWGRRVLHFGSKKCMVCGGRVSRFLDYGHGFEVLERLQVIGGLRRNADCCPICHSSARERLVWFWLSQKGEGFRFQQDCRIAHFAPEKGLSFRLIKAAPGNYRAYDLDPGRYRHLRTVQRADLSRLEIEDASVDLVICNHVLEHVPDVYRSLGEIHRILAQGGKAILQVPIALLIEDTIELGVESTREDRVRHLGQDDHLRLFSRQAFERVVTDSGFRLQSYRAFDEDGQAALEWRLDPFETLFVCEKVSKRT